MAHVEAGLRSFDRTMPEELNRIVVDRISALLFCPSELAARNLAAEAVTEGVHVVGDVMLDANLRLAPLARERSRALADAGVEPGRYLLLTLHRQANAEPASLTRIAAALNRLEEPVVFPAHPRTTAALETHGIELPEHTCAVLPAVGYLDFAALASQARVVLTDSGGVQKEAYWYGVPCVTLRTTDRVGGDGRGRVEPPRRRRSRAHRDAPSSTPARSRRIRRSTATATPPCGSPSSWSLR